MVHREPILASSQSAVRPTKTVPFIVTSRMRTQYERSLSIVESGNGRGSDMTKRELTLFALLFGLMLQVIVGFIAVMVSTPEFRFAPTMSLAFIVGWEIIGLSLLCVTVHASYCLLAGRPYAEEKTVEEHYAFLMAHKKYVKIYKVLDYFNQHIAPPPVGLLEQILLEPMAPHTTSLRDRLQPLYGVLADAPPDKPHEAFSFYFANIPEIVGLDMDELTKK